MSKFSDLDRLDFLECYVRHKLDLKAVCTEYNLKYNTAATRLKTIQDGCAKRRSGETGDVNGGGKAVGKAKTTPKSKAGSSKEKIATKTPKKRKLAVMENDERKKEEEEE